MIRTPTNLWEAYAPWRDKLAGKPVPLHADSPEPGFYWRRFVRGGPRVAVAIWIEQEIDETTGLLLAPERVVALCNGRYGRADQHWNYCCDNAISHEAYKLLVAGFDQDPAISPIAETSRPVATLERPTDPLATPPIF